MSNHRARRTGPPTACADHFRSQQTHLCRLDFPSTIGRIEPSDSPILIDRVLENITDGVRQARRLDGWQNWPHRHARDCAAAKPPRLERSAAICGRVPERRLRHHRGFVGLRRCDGPNGICGPARGQSLRAEPLISRITPIASAVSPAQRQPSMMGRRAPGPKTWPCTLARMSQRRSRDVSQIEASPT